jgi:phage terminase small subunit
VNRRYEDKVLDGFPNKMKEAVPEINEPGCELPEPPDHLNAISRRLWFQLGNMLVTVRVITPAEFLLLTAICRKPIRTTTWHVRVLGQQ